VSRYIDEHRGRFGVEPICRVLHVSASAYYQRARGRRSARVVADERLLSRIREMHAANYYAYGYRRTWKALLRAGEQVGRDHVRRLMRAHGIQGAKRRGKPWRTTTPDPRALRRAPRGITTPGRPARSSVARMSRVQRPGAGSGRSTTSNSACRQTTALMYGDSLTDRRPRSAAPGDPSPGGDG
jgi:putative transposase